MAKRRKSGKDKAADQADAELWSQVVASVRPLHRKVGETAVIKKLPQSGLEKAPDESRGIKQTPGPRTVAAKPKPIRQAPAPKAPPAFTGLDRRTSQKLTRGNTEIDATLDLHGMSREIARIALGNFLIASVSMGRRTVLVITGKGHSPYSSHTLHGYQHVETPEWQGVIRKAFPQWLEEPDIRAYVAGYQPAHPRHGGGGAFYLRLRKHKN